MIRRPSSFFLNDTATTEIYTLSLHDALPIFLAGPSGSASWSHSTTNGSSRKLSKKSLRLRPVRSSTFVETPAPTLARPSPDRKSTRLNSSHANISYAVFCLKKKIQLLLLLEK